jgi:spore coat polysaccharide biosynthesis predicted glycosyltransferase SpsG
MRLVFRADASKQIGSGHVMRVTTIAEEAITRGIECHFVGQVTELDWVVDHVNNLGFSSITDDPNSWISDAENDVLILDSYITPINSRFASGDVWRLFVTVTDGFTPNYPADIEVCQNLTRSEANDSRQLLTGPQYSLIRKSINKKPAATSNGGPVSILLTGGGSDPYGFVHAVLDELELVDQEFQVHVFSNGILSTNENSKIRFYPIGKELDNVANFVDLAITTASTSSIEFLAREIPTLIACAIDNQLPTYSQLSEMNYALPIGVRDSAGHWQFDRQVISDAIHNHLIREELWLRTNNLIDLKGPERVVDAIVEMISKGEVRR